MSCCCPREDPQYKYEVKMSQDGHDSYKYVNSLQELDPLFREQENVSITKVKTQVGLLDLKQQMKSNNQKFTDSLFPPNQASLGSHIPNSIWKRIPELIKYEKPCLFDRKIQPSDVISGHTGDCYLLSSLAALAEYPDIIKKIFRGQKENDEGIYRVNLRVNGVVEQVVIDDFVPVQENGNPIFCQPNRKTGEFWVVLLEKALAKVKGSYSNLNQGTPSDIFRMVTYAPSESMVFSNENQQHEKIWTILQEYTKNSFPFCASTHNLANEAQGLEKTHTYTIVSAMELLDNHNQPVRVLKLRNPWKTFDYHGRGSISDTSFWGGIPDNQAKSAFFAKNNNCEYGLFYMTFQDFCQNFNQIHFCNLDNGGKFVSQNLLIGKKASFYDVSIQRQGIYTLELNHSAIKGQTKAEEETEGTGRSTFLLVKKEKGDLNTYKFHFVNGIMRYNEANLMLTEKLSPGDYVIYAKVEPPFNSEKLPQTAVINLYSKLFASLQPVLRTKYPNLLRDTFLTHAQQSKRAVYEEGKIWLSWQLLVDKGGFGYIAAGNSRDSKQSVVINLSQQQFNAEHFKLKKPFKGIGEGQQVRIKPGQQNIIVLRVMNNPSVKSIKLPANIDIRLEPLYR